ncbi:RBR-type E3 ubiquitin transferase [Sergentomyia squamirostris]
MLLAKRNTLMVKMLPVGTVPPEFSGQQLLYDVVVDETTKSVESKRFCCDDSVTEDNFKRFFVSASDSGDNLWFGESDIGQLDLKKGGQTFDGHLFSDAEDGGGDSFENFINEGSDCMKNSCERDVNTLFASSASFSTKWSPHSRSNSNNSSVNLVNNAQDIAYARTLFTKKGINNCFSEVALTKNQLFARESEKPLLTQFDEDNYCDTASSSGASSICEDEEIVQFRQKIQTSQKIPAENRRSLQLHLFADGSATSDSGKNQYSRHSWYAPTKSYDTLFEDSEQEVKESFLQHNLAAHHQHTNKEARDSTALLERTLHQTRSKKSRISASSTTIQELQSGPHVANSAAATTIGGQPAPRMRRFEQLLKNLVGKKTPSSSGGSAAATASCESSGRLTAPQLRIDKSPSEYDLTRDEKSKRIGGSTSSLNSVQQRLWTVVPLLKRDASGSCSSLEKVTPTRATSCANTTSLQHEISVHQGLNMRKCETYLTLTQPSAPLEPLKPLNRLRNSASIATCSRCSSLLSLAAAGSRYSLNVAGGGFVPIDGGGSGNISDSSCYSASVQVPPPPPAVIQRDSTIVPCKLCLGEVNRHQLTKIRQCGCSFCTECMKAYVEFEILEGAYEISCPDAMCPMQGIISIQEVSTLVSSSLMEKHHRYRLNREVERDRNRTWCPKAGCETVCLVDAGASSTSPVAASRSVTFQLPHAAGGASCSALPPPCLVHCPTCREDFCSGCKKAWHPLMTCEENTRRLAADGRDTDNIGILFDGDLIKCCPMCAVPIEKDEGCAQMMCKRCKHVFCWYCLASLDDDFLLRHYDKGPCKNKLGHSRASVVWHRAQVIGIFAGFGILLLVASPLLLLAAPCIVCCKCRICSGAAKLEEQEGAFDDAVRLQR